MTPPTAVASPDAPTRPDDESIERGTWGGERKHAWEQVALALFIGIPFLAVIAAVPVAWGGFLGWHDVILAVLFYTISGHGISIGFHRYFTHKSFKPNRPLKIVLAVAGSLAIEGPVIRWVADHRKHHKFSDRDGDPHSPWRYGNSIGGLTKGLYHAHIGWLFDPEQTPQRQYAPDLLKDPDVVKVSRAFLYIVLFSLLAPAVIGGLWSWSLGGALTAFFWASLVRIALLHHVDPTCARHGVLKGQLDTSARIIRWFEQAGWVTDVRWPVKERLEARRVEAGAWQQPEMSGGREA